MGLINFILVVMIISTVVLVGGETLSEIYHTNFVGAKYALMTGLFIVFILSAAMIINSTVTYKFRARELDEAIIVKYDNIQFEQSQIKEINNQLVTIVQEYANHEEDIFIEASNIESVVLASQIYPELKSDKLYQSLMTSYNQHNNNLVSGIKDYNQMIKKRRTLNHRPIVGRFIPESDLSTITNININ